MRTALVFLLLALPLAAQGVDFRGSAPLGVRDLESIHDREADLWARAEQGLGLQPVPEQVQIERDDMWRYREAEMAQGVGGVEVLKQWLADDLRQRQNEVLTAFGTSSVRGLYGVAPEDGAEDYASWAKWILALRDELRITERR